MSQEEVLTFLKKNKNRWVEPEEMAENFGTSKQSIVENARKLYLYKEIERKEFRKESKRITFIYKYKEIKNAK